jgi:hypothetical protein
MRTIDRRTQVGRRAILRGGATALPAAALASAGVGISAEAAWAQSAKALSPDVMATLVKMSRDIYPHDHIADSFYVTAASPWDEKAGKDPAFKALLTDGVARADADAKDRYGKPYIAVAWEADRVRILQGIEQTAFFKKVRGDLVVSLYNQEAIWPKFGYEGSSADKGGYIHRGFDDINWLPTA